MLFKSITGLICILVVATGHSDSASITGPDLIFTAYSLGNDNSESPTTAQIQEDTKAEAVDLTALLDAGEAAMVTLVAGDTRLMAHRALLAARSHVFAAADASSSHIFIPDMEGPVLRQLVAYLYTLQVPQLPNMAGELLVAADRYGLQALREECERQVAAQLSVENAAAVAVFAVKHSYTGLGQAAVTFIRDHLVQVMATEAWAVAMHTYTDELIRVSQMLSDLPAENGIVPTTTTTELPTDRSHCGKRPAASAPSRTTRHTATPQAACGSILRGLSEEKKGKWLIEAAKEGNVEELQALINARADLEMMDESAREWDKWTAMHWAAWEGNVEVVRRLMEAGVDPNIRSAAKLTPLQVAAWSGWLDVVQLLLANCVDVNTTNLWGFTPLHEAAKHGHPEVAAALLEAGADTDAETEKGKTPLDLAIDYGHYDVADLLRSS